MSRIGKLPINIPAGVTVTLKDNVVNVKGPKGELSQKVATASTNMPRANPGICSPLESVNR